MARQTGHAVSTVRRAPRAVRRRVSRRLRAGVPERRLRAALVVSLFTLSLLGGRLVQLQGLDASALAAQALKGRTADVTLVAHRGDITDSRGVVLATTVERVNVTVDQTLVPKYTKLVGDVRRKVGVPGAAADIAPLVGLPVATVQQRLTGSRHFAYVARGVSPQAWHQVARLAVPGINREQASRRVYPEGQVAAAVLGFQGVDGTAFGGIEGAYNRLLTGRPGSVRYEQGLDGAQIPTGVSSEVEPVDGSIVRLTLDSDLQWKAQQVLAAQVKATGSESGYLVVENPRTGEILALATVPTFDANDPGKSSVSDRNNGALLDMFEPGSTAKVVSVAAAMQEGVATPTTRVSVPGSLRRAGTVFHDAEAHGTEQLTATGVLAQSSNLGTIELSEKVPATTLYRYQTLFGIGKHTGIGLTESVGILAPPSQWYGSQRYTVLFGQGMAVTALQAAGVFATIANNGVRMPARIVAGTTTPDKVFHPRPAGTPVRVISPDTATELRQMLENVVGENGTAVKAAIPGYRVAGKTGTAEAPDSTCQCYRGYTASFIGMAPADDPQLVVAVVLQRPSKGSHFGGQIAAPVFQQVMTYALAEQKIPPTGTTAPTMPLTWR